MNFFEKTIYKKRGWISKWPKRAVFICSGGMDSMVTIAKLLQEKNVEIFPLFINRGQSNIKSERSSINFFNKYFRKKYGELFHETKEVHINVPIKEIKDDLRKYSKNFGYPLRNTILQMVGVQYAISISEKTKKRVASVLCAQIDDDPFPHSKLISLRSTTLDICQNLDEWDWQITSPNIDEILDEKKFFKKDMVLWSFRNDFPIEKTRSCYSRNRIHCGHCLACGRRRKAFLDANILDKTKYMGNK